METNVNNFIPKENKLNYTVKDVLCYLKRSEQKFELGDGTYSNRGNSWEFCFLKFKQAYKAKHSTPKKIDDLAQSLAVYLSSWGMYRGSSFLLNSDYKVHIKPIKMILKHKDLSINDNLFDEPTLKDRLFGDQGIYNELELYYKSAKKSLGKSFVKNEIPSDTLISKILLGVYGCIPAYDQNFKRGISCWDGIQTLTSNGSAIYGGNHKKIKSLEQVLDNKFLYEELCSYWKSHPKYTFMKVVDMYFYGLGILIGEDKAKKQSAKAEIKNYYQI